MTLVPRAYRISVLWLLWLLVSVTRLRRRMALRRRVVAVALLGWTARRSAFATMVSTEDHGKGKQTRSSCPAAAAAAGIEAAAAHRTLLGCNPDNPTCQGARELKGSDRSWKGSIGTLLRLEKVVDGCEVLRGVARVVGDVVVEALVVLGRDGQDYVRVRPKGLVSEHGQLGDGASGLLYTGASRRGSLME